MSKHILLTGRSSLRMRFICRRKRLHCFPHGHRASEDRLQADASGQLLQLEVGFSACLVRASPRAHEATLKLAGVDEEQCTLLEVGDWRLFWWVGWFERQGFDWACVRAARSLRCCYSLRCFEVRGWILAKASSVLPEQSDRYFQPSGGDDQPQVQED